MGEPRGFRLCFTLNDDELKAVHEAAGSAGLTYGAYARQVVLESALESTPRTGPTIQRGGLVAETR